MAYASCGLAPLAAAMPSAYVRSSLASGSSSTSNRPIDTGSARIDRSGYKGDWVKLVWR
jgi:hypothetical protein